MAGIASTANRESRIRSADGQQAQGMLMPSVLQSASNLTACERQVAPRHGPSKAQLHCDCRYPAESTRVGGHGTPPPHGADTQKHWLEFRRSEAEAAVRSFDTMHSLPLPGQNP